MAVRIQVIDSHTGGEPTRVVISGGPDLGTGTLAERRARFRDDHDDFRSAVVNEPRGSDVLVGALLCRACRSALCRRRHLLQQRRHLGMCGHGTIGLAVTLAHLGEIKPGKHLLETPVGVVGFDVRRRRIASTIENVPSYRLGRQRAVEVEGIGDGPRRHRLGRQLVLPRQRPRPGA